MRRCAILCTDRQLLPITTGNRLRILGVLAALRALDWRVILVGIPGAAPDEALRRLVDGFVAVRARPFAGGDLDRFDPRPFRHCVHRLCRELKPTLVIAEYVWLSPVLERLPRFVRRIVDCHDVFHERTERFRAAALHPWVTCSREQELRRLEIADVILATQEHEADLLRSLLPGRRVACIPTPIDLPRGFARRPVDGPVVLTVGADHPGNQAVLAFARDVWPRVVERVPGARLLVVGSIAGRLPPLPGVENVGPVPDVQDYYAGASVVACPVTVGTGVKTKLLEALRYGKAVVATAAAREGMPEPPRRSWVTAPTLSGCADAIVALLTDPAARAELESAAFEFGERHLGPVPFRRQLESVLPNAVTRSLAWLAS